MIERVLRSVAIVIALLALVDPQFTMHRQVRPVVAVASSDGDSSLYLRTIEALKERFVVVDAPFPGAATVVTGAGFPDHSDMFSTPVVGVLPDSGSRVLEFGSIDAPTWATLGTRSVIRATLSHGQSQPGDSLVLQLRVGGVLLGESRRMAGSARTTLEVPFIAASEGLQQLQLAALHLRGRDTVTEASTPFVTNVTVRTWRVLVADARASWMSTFVRRTLEADSRFDVVSRVATSRGIAFSSGDAVAVEDFARMPASELDLYDAVIVGAPDAATAAMSNALERYMRVRGGAVLLLLDVAAPTPFDRLIGSGSLQAREVASGADVRVTGDTAPMLRVSEFVSPASLGAEALIEANVVQGSELYPVMYHVPVGAGRLMVSGALDAWRYREPEQSQFARAWPDIIANMASRSLPPITLEVYPALASPGEELRVRVAVRDAMLIDEGESWTGELSATVSGRDNITLYPSQQAGILEGSFIAPSMPPDANVVTLAVSISAKGVMHKDSAAVAVAENVQRTGGQYIRVGDSAGMPDDFLVRWLEAHGGFAITPAEFAQLPERIGNLVGRSEQEVAVHPMRSPWWILPFTLALGAEWWLRRRRGRT